MGMRNNGGMMIRIAAAYPRQAGKKFNMDYYLHTHLPLVAKKFGPYGLTKVEVDKGIEKPGGGESPFFAIGYLYFKTLDGFHQAFAQAGTEVISTIPLYTDVEPMIQIGEITEC